MGKTKKFLRSQLMKFMQFLYDDVLSDEDFGLRNWDKIVDEFLRKPR